MVTVTIIGIAAGAVVLTSPQAGSVTHDAARLAAVLTRARDEAILTSRTVEVRLSPTGYDFDTVQGGVRKPLTGRSFLAANWASGVRAASDSGERIVFDAIGLAEGAHVVLTDGRRSAGVTVDPSGKVSVNGV
jgi:hypothetical protein